MTLTAEQLGDRLRHLLDNSGTPHAAVASAADMDATALSKVLAGKRRLSSLELAQICEALNVDPMVVLNDGSPSPDPAEASIARLRHMIRLDGLLTELGYPPDRERRYPATLLDRAAEAYLAGHVSIRPIAGLLGVDADALLDGLRGAQERARLWS